MYSDVVLSNQTHLTSQTRNSFFYFLIMKKVKAAVAAMDFSPPSHAIMYEDQRIMFKHQSLMQDYDELYKIYFVGFCSYDLLVAEIIENNKRNGLALFVSETEAKKRKLQMMRQKKLTLMAEVRFLRRRYKYLTRNKSQKPPMKQNLVQPQNSVVASKKLKKEKNSSGNNVSLGLPVKRFDLNQKGKVYIDRETTLRNPAPIFDLNKKQRTLIGKEVALRNTSTIPDLNQKERTYSIKEVTIRNNTPVFDLNEISTEEEEQVNGDMLRTEEPKVSLMRGASDEIHNERKLSACRNVGNGSSRAGKRKITWQDQVALRA
ncbi:hypothetical protein SADUNF_Sadunf06G0143100 [Salix dunnii]|uniref:Uncharacterized protein n=1 Tax=Salix dunnii TaxID=1413687 RepID=A0A835MX87_9ROSI|nr:hypothetical protein SADUNF_Sadunf06G0143100 [Salix dunnii]